MHKLSDLVSAGMNFIWILHLNFKSLIYNVIYSTNGTVATHSSTLKH